MKHASGLSEWFGHVTMGSRFTVGEDKSMAPQYDVNYTEMEYLERTAFGSQVEVLDMVRVKAAETTILSEEALNAWMVNEVSTLRPHINVT